MSMPLGECIYCRRLRAGVMRRRAEEDWAVKKYTIRTGDTLYIIAKRTGVRIPLLLAANPELKGPNDLMPGMTIVIPELGKAGKGQSEVSKHSAGKQGGSHSGGSHSGDVKLSGSKESGLKSDVGKASGLKESGLKESGSKSDGAKASESALPPYFGFVWPYVVQVGDTLSSLAKKFRVSEEQLLHLNGLKKNVVLYPGSVLFFPDLTMSDAPFQAQTAASSTPMHSGKVPKGPSTKASSTKDEGEGPNTHGGAYRQEALIEGASAESTGRGQWSEDRDAFSISSWDSWVDGHHESMRQIDSEAEDADGDGWSDVITYHEGEQ
jgi:LysM repeat protein